ncbi:sensory transduction protein kinase [Bacillus sp. JCM 19045]|nr:sensory transduction protein kinase [Bacillus sp. JCM 19045]
MILIVGISSLFIVLDQSRDYAVRDYYQTNDFENELDTFLFNVARFELAPTSLEEALENIDVTEGDIEEHRYYYGDLYEQIQSIRSNYQADIDMYEDSSDMAELLREERDEKIADIRMNFEDDEYVAEKIREEKERQVKEEFGYLDGERRSFQQSKNALDYFLVHAETGEVHTNMTNVDEDSWEDAFAKEEMHFSKTFKTTDATLLNIQDFYTEYGGSVYGEAVNMDVPENVDSNYEGAVGVPRDSNSYIATYAKTFQERQLILLGMLVVGLGSLTAAWFTRKKVDFYEGLNTRTFAGHVKRIPPDIVLALVIILGIVTLIAISDMTIGFYYYNDYSLYSILSNFTFLLVSASLFLLLAYYSYYAWKDERSFADWRKKTVSYRTFAVVRGAFEQSSVGFQVVGIMAVAFAFGFGFWAIFLFGFAFILYVFAVLFIGLPLLFMLFKRVGYFNQIVAQARNIVAGQSTEALPVKGHSVLAELASSLNQMKEGVRTSRTQQAKSERLKTELITNVSHDLRTPLTSVITYTELLKNDNLSEEERNAYIDIIDRKSQRLKVLIEDLFEASKMASGSIELNKANVDLKQLLTQTLAENSQAIEASSLQFRVNEQTEPLTAYVDGQKLWRVFDNLIVNILNYSLAETRVYINARKEGNQIQISFKNITRYELGANTDELLERFKRGDTSRNTEGSGLGLAIAKSIVDLHDGDLTLEVDGDLFKATVILPAS